MSLSQERIDIIIRRYVKGSLETMKENDAVEPASRGRPPREDDLNEDFFGRCGPISALELHAAELKEYLAMGDYGDVTKTVDGIIERYGLPIERKSEDYFRLAHEILNADIRL